ncbi:MAG: ethanolamine ammonia-lyase subunit EutB [Clostridia bacterium]|nr:ethanolamine ammonia-lyase subunit EutB [Clostridia bacterium]
MAKANELKSGDCLAGIAAQTKLERIAAKRVLSQLTVAQIRNHPAVSYEKDFVTQIIQDDVDEAEYEKVKDWTIGELREWLLDSQTSGNDMLKCGRGLSSECIAAVAKLMGNLDLMYAGNKMTILATCNTTIGQQGVLASRLQPNHPTDDERGVRASVLEGLSYGIGDAVLGLNPAIDTVDSTLSIWRLLEEIKEKYEIPTQTCVLSHISTQMKALAAGGRADLCFQSLAGSQEACEAFGISRGMLDEGWKMFLEEGSAVGENVMYFETGQASELSSDAHNGWDQVTMECRCYGLARHYKPFLVNTVVGFMGPEYLYDSSQLLRAGLEDVFCGHLHGLPMGCDACYTNHMPVDQNDIEDLAVMLSAAGCHYFMGLPQGDDVMLMYQSTGYHDIAALREMSGKQPIEEFRQWLEKRGIWVNGGLGPKAGNPAIFTGGR